MGCSNSKFEKSEALRLCRDRKRFINQAIDSRYALAAAHLSYVQSLRSVGIALRRFAEVEVSRESSLSTSATELDKYPSNSSYPSPSPSHNAEIVDSPLNNERPHSPPPSTLSYVRSSGSASVTVTLDSSLNRFVDDESLNVSSPPPSPPPDSGSSWDFFYPVGSSDNLAFRFENVCKQNFDNLTASRQLREEEVGRFMKEEVGKWEKVGFKGNNGSIREETKLEFEGVHETLVKTNRSNAKLRNAYTFSGFASDRFADSEESQIKKEKILQSADVASGPTEALVSNVSSEHSISKRVEKTGMEQEVREEREDPSEFITHRAKDFLSSIKDIEHRFFRASESGKEVSRMLEASKIHFSYLEDKGRSTASLFLAACHLVCCTRSMAHLHELPQHVPKVITWHRSTSSQSSSSKIPLARRHDVDDSGSDFVEEFCMIAGTHSSTLDRLYAWERKLYDDVKACESIRKEYDRKCNLLRQQFARDLNPQVIDKTRAIVKDLHSQIRVAIHTVDSISKRIERLRDEELQPQLVELMQGMIRMWKVMLECHHAQYISISLAYHTRSSTTAPQSESGREVITHLQNEIECFGSSFVEWISAHQTYVDSLNSWLQNCILLPQERSRRRMAFSPRRAIAPPIFVLCRDWLGGIKALPSMDLADAIKDFVLDLQHLFDQHVEEQQKTETPEDLGSNRETENKEDDKCAKVSSLSSIQASLTRTFDQLTKFSEASLKLHEDVRAATEKAHGDYTNPR